MRKNSINGFAVDVDLYKNNKFIPSVLLALLDHSQWKYGDNFSTVYSLNKTKLLNYINKDSKIITMNTLTSQLKFLVDFGKIIIDNNNVTIVGVDSAYVVLNKEQKEVIRNIKNKHTQRLALLHLNSIKFFGGEHFKSLETIANELGVSKSHLNNITKMNKELKELGVIKYNLIHKNSSFVNIYTTSM